MEEKLEKLREKYSQALRKGLTDRATDYYWKIQELKNDEVSEEVEEAKNIYSNKLQGVGEETAEELDQLYEDWEDFKDNVTKESLVDISGIGKKTAENIIEQVNE